MRIVLVPLVLLAVAGCNIERQLEQPDAGAAAIAAAEPCLRIEGGELVPPQRVTGLFPLPVPTLVKLTGERLGEIDGDYYVAAVPRPNRGQGASAAAWTQVGDTTVIMWASGETRYLVMLGAAVGDTASGRLERVRGLPSDGYRTGSVRAVPAVCDDVHADPEATTRMLTPQTSPPREI